VRELRVRTERHTQLLDITPAVREAVDGATGAAVLEAADDALYAAKAAGRDTYCTAQSRGPAPSVGASPGPQPPRQSRAR
jgi:PleD family two-component response regulator